MHNMEQTGAGYVEVSAHWGARTGKGHANHAGWQGKVYKVDGSDGVYGNLEQETGYPSDPAGLHGYNCRHTFYPFWPGISEPNTWPPEPGPKEWNGRTYDYYTATQEQRRREREIRALKREQNACKEAGLDRKAKQLGGLIETKTAEYEEFSDAMEISAKRNRLRVTRAVPVKMFRKKGTHYKIGVRGRKIIPDPVYNRIIEIVKRHNGKVMRGDPEVVEHLDKMKADASQIGGVLLFRSDPTISEVLEEVHHFNQDRMGLNADKSEELRQVLNEIDAKKYLLDMTEKYKIPEEEVEETRRQLEHYQNVLARME